jgi:segregation and condensation protein B
MDYPTSHQAINDNALSQAAFATALRLAEALLFASPEPLSEEEIARYCPAGIAIDAVLAELERIYRPRGVNLVRLAGKWTFRTAPDLGYLLRKEAEEPRKFSRAALEVLAIIAYHQPVTRAEIEEIRGVALSKGTLDLLLEAGFVKLRGRRRSPGRPVTLGTTEAFLVQFGLDRISDLPGLEDLQDAGLITGQLPQGFGIPLPKDAPGLGMEEDPLEPDLYDVMSEARLEAIAAEAPLDPEPEASPAPHSRQANG